MTLNDIEIRLRNLKSEREAIKADFQQLMEEREARGCLNTFTVRLLIEEIENL